MSAAELQQITRVRRLRESKAERRYRQAKALQARAEAALAAARGNLAAFDVDLERSAHAFVERARDGIYPDAVKGMRTYRAERLMQRPNYVEAIQIAIRALEEARAVTARLRQEWQREAVAAENLQEITDEKRTEQLRELGRRAERDADELTTARSSRAGRE